SGPPMQFLSGVDTRIRRGRKAALTIIDKFGAQFKQGDDAALMAMWRRQLSEGTEERLQKFVVSVRRTRKPAPLVAYLSLSDTSAEDVAVPPSRSLKMPPAAMPPPSTFCRLSQSFANESPIA